MNLLILGASGMLGHTLFKYFSQRKNVNVFGTIRSTRYLKYFSSQEHKNLISDIDLEKPDSLFEVLALVQPDAVINCAGLVKQNHKSKNPLLALAMNSILPHRIASICKIINSKFVHISTDCVFSGERGHYSELDKPDANDLYGRTKLLGEVEGKSFITIRTSIIGHELEGSQSLIDWFLSQDKKVEGFAKAIFSGLPTIEIAKILDKHIIPNAQLEGLFHVGGYPISKYELLKLVAKQYNKSIEIIPNEKLAINRSLNCNKFLSASKYKPKSWQKLISDMHEFR